MSDIKEYNVIEHTSSRYMEGEGEWIILHLTTDQAFGLMRKIFHGYFDLEFYVMPIEKQEEEEESKQSHTRVSITEKTTWAMPFAAS